MGSTPDPRPSRVVRLNATLMPPPPREAALYRRYGLAPQLVEANTPEAIIPLVAECDAIVVVSAALPRAVIDRLDRCRVISRLGIGTDKIDVARAAERGILVTNVPSFCDEEMAEHVMAMLLSLARQLPRMDADFRAGAYGRARASALRNRRLTHCTLGLVGFGASARLTAQRARAFGLRVLATRQRLDAPSPEAIALGVELVDLDTLLRQSDFVSLHLPLTPATHHLLDAARLRQMKPGAYLINAARGAIVDEMALAEALLGGQLAGAALDTFEHVDVFAEQPVRSHHPLASLDGVIFSPHVAALSVQAMEEVSQTGVDNVATVLAGYWPPAHTVVNQGVVPRQPLAAHDPGLLNRLASD